MKFLPNEKLEKYSQDAVKKLVNKACTDLERLERKARDIVENNTVFMHMEVCNGMWPWLSDVSFSKESDIYLYRNQMNHNSIYPNLSNKITNKFLGNPIGVDLSGKVHTKDMGTGMTYFLTHNDKVSTSTTLENLQFVKVFHHNFFYNF